MKKHIPSVTGGLPKNVSGTTKTYMSYKAINDRTCRQWRLFHRKKNRPKADSKKYMKVGKDYCIALGSCYGTWIGNRYRITFEKSNGKKYHITAILSDQKTDGSTDKRHQYNKYDKSIVEFITNGKPKVNPSIRFKGRVSKIQRYR